MTENNQANKSKFFCDNCQEVKEGNYQKGSYVKRLVDAPFEPRMHKKLCFICKVCQPYVKEYNEAQDQNNEDNSFRYF
jgi:hypothetical protein